MSPRRPHRKPSSFRPILRLSLRSRACWASWRLSRSRRLLTREQRRTALLLQAADSSLLRQKELEQLLRLHQHRLAEMRGSKALREQALLPELEQRPLPPELLVPLQRLEQQLMPLLPLPLEPMPPPERRQLDQLLGLPPTE